MQKCIQLILFIVLPHLAIVIQAKDSHRPESYPGSRQSDAVFVERTDKWYGSFGIAGNSYNLSCRLCKDNEYYDNSGTGIGLEFGRTIDYRLRLGLKYNHTNINDENNYFEFDNKVMAVYADYLFRHFYIGLALNHASFSDERENRNVESAGFSQFRFGSLFRLDENIFADMALGIGLTGKADFTEDFIDSSNIDHGKPKFKNMLSFSIMFGHFF